MNEKLQRYLLTGAGLGAYLGIVFRPLREPNIQTVLLLSILMVVVTFISQLIRRKGRPIQQILQKMPIKFAQYFLFVGALETRHQFYEWGGRWAVVPFMIIVGALLGVWYYKTPLDT